MPDSGADDFRGPSAANPFVDQLVALIVDDAEVTASNWQDEFDWIVTAVPRQPGAAPLEVMVGPESQVVVHSAGLFWWTFGSGWGEDPDGYALAWTVIEQLVERGGVLRRGWKTTQLSDASGRLMSGPNRNDGMAPRARTTIVESYRSKQ